MEEGGGGGTDGGGPLTTLGEAKNPMWDALAEGLFTH